MTSFHFSQSEGLPAKYLALFYLSLSGLEILNMILKRSYDEIKTCLGETISEIGAPHFRKFEKRHFQRYNMLCV
jgi:hypothetical protein